MMDKEPAKTDNEWNFGEAEVFEEDTPEEFDANGIPVPKKAPYMMAPQYAIPSIVPGGQAEMKKVLIPLVCGAMGVRCVVT